MKKQWNAWGDADDALLRHYWLHTTLPVKQFAHHFGNRSDKAIAAHASDIGLGKRPRGVRTQAAPTEFAIKSALAIGPMESVELSAKTGISRRAVMARLNGLYEAGAVHIHAWVRFGQHGYWARVYALGSGKDARRPQAMSKTERDRKRIDRMRKEDPAAYAARLARRRIAAATREGRFVRRDIAATALFGEAA
ncbi:transcriptional regulator [Paraburkholderia phymatum]|uniref:transcriptional regulator n=1 Tax=Paraburkholderia phymatum TaxID=148447 RepID=UPI00316C815A